MVKPDVVIPQKPVIVVDGREHPFTEFSLDQFSDETHDWWELTLVYHRKKRRFQGVGCCTVETQGIGPLRYTFVSARGKGQA